MAKSASKVPTKIQQQRDNAAAMAKGQTEGTPAEPSFDDRIAEINRRARQRAEEEIAQLVLQNIGEAERAFARAVSNTTDEAVKVAFDNLQKMRRLGGKTGAAIENGSATSTRVRRSAEDLASDAEKLAEYLRANPGSKGSAAVKSTGAIVKAPLNVKTFIEKFYPGKIKVKTEGQKAGTTYSIG